MKTEEEILLREHEELIQLFIHEDKLAWNIIYFYIVANLGLSSALVILISSSSPFSFPAFFLCIIGSGFGIIFYFAFQRSKIHWHSRLYRALEIENKFNAHKDMEFKTFSSCESKIWFEKPPKCLKDAKGNYRKLKWRERREILGAIDRYTFGGAIIWVSLALYILINKFLY